MLTERIFVFAEHVFDFRVHFFGELAELVQLLVRHLDERRAVFEDFFWLRVLVADLSEPHADVSEFLRYKSAVSLPALYLFSAPTHFVEPLAIDGSEPDDGMLIDMRFLSRIDDLRLDLISPSCLALTLLKSLVGSY